MCRSPVINMVGNDSFPSSEGEGIYSSPNGQKPFSGVREAPPYPAFHGVALIRMTLPSMRKTSENLIVHPVDACFLK